MWLGSYYRASVFSWIFLYHFEALQKFYQLYKNWRGGQYHWSTMTGAFVNYHWFFRYFMSMWPNVVRIKCCCSVFIPRQFYTMLKPSGTAIQSYEKKAARSCIEWIKQDNYHESPGPFLMQCSLSKLLHPFIAKTSCISLIL